MLKSFLLFLLIFLFSSSSAQDTAFITHNSKSCNPCYLDLYEFCTQNDLNTKVIGLALVDTSFFNGEGDKAMAQELFQFCDSIIYIDAYKDNTYLKPVKNLPKRFYNSYLTKPSPMLIIKRRNKQIIFPVKQLSNSNGLSEKVKNALLKK